MPTEDSNTRLAITMGDPAGVGAEILVKAFCRGALNVDASVFVVGSAACLQEEAQRLGLELQIRTISTVQDADSSAGELCVYEPVAFDTHQRVMGQVSAACGQAAVGYFEAAVNHCLEGDIAGVVTCPINKEAVHAAGFHGDIGHQEILARMTGSQLTATMLMTEGLKVAHLSTHKSLADAVAYVRQPVLVEKLTLTWKSLQRWGLSQPRIAVAALNPHGGEGGLLGREEIEEVAPAVAACREQGMDIMGPFPADSVFYRAIAGEFDAVMALYHDQGHIAIKVHNFEQSVTATMGIPFVRTSVDHGTAFDIAGQGKADDASLVRALMTASDMLNQSLK